MDIIVLILTPMKTRLIESDDILLNRDMVDMPQISQKKEDTAYFTILYDMFVTLDNYIILLCLLSCFVITYYFTFTKDL